MIAHHHCEGCGRREGGEGYGGCGLLRALEQAQVLEAARKPRLQVLQPGPAFAGAKPRSGGQQRDTVVNVNTWSCGHILMSRPVGQAKGRKRRRGRGKCSKIFTVTMRRKNTAKKSVAFPSTLTNAHSSSSFSPISQTVLSLIDLWGTLPTRPRGRHSRTLQSKP